MGWQTWTFRLRLPWVDWTWLCGILMAVDTGDCEIMRDEGGSLIALACWPLWFQKPLVRGQAPGLALVKSEVVVWKWLHVIKSRIALRPNYGHQLFIGISWTQRKVVRGNGAMKKGQMARCRSMSKHHMRPSPAELQRKYSHWGTCTQSD